MIVPDFHGIEYEDFPLSIWNDIENHFIGIMQMRCVNDFDDSEKTFNDNHITMIISIGNRASELRKDGHIAIRIVIKSWNTSKSFSKTRFFDMSESIIDFIYNTVKYDGGTNSDILENWKEIKKPELRDIKLNNLGI